MRLFWHHWVPHIQQNTKRNSKLQKREHIISERDRLSKKWFLKGRPTYLQLGSKVLQNRVAQNNSRFVMSWFYGFEQIWRRNCLHLIQFLLENFSLKMRFLNDVSHNNWNGMERQYFWGILRDSSASRGITGGHSVASWQMVGLGNQDGSFTRVVCGRGVTHARFCWDFLPERTNVASSAWWSQGGKLTQQLRPPRGSHMTPFTHIYILLCWLGNHKSSQIRGGEHRLRLLMKSRSKNLRLCFKTAKGMESIGG